MPQANLTGLSVLIVEDETLLRKQAAAEFEQLGADVTSAVNFESARKWLGDLGFDFVLLDVHLPDGSGLDLLARLERSQTALAVVLVSGYGDVQSTVRAMRLGALDFLTKPIEEERLVETVTEATAKSVALWHERSEIAVLRTRFDRLTPREREVCTLVASGLLNKQIASQLSRSEKTVKVHRGRVMRKLEVSSVAELVRLLARLDHPRS